MKLAMTDRLWLLRAGTSRQVREVREDAPRDFADVADFARGNSIGRRTTARGIRATARALGVSPSHLSQVVSGKRRSLRLERRLAALGVRCADARP